jgi:dsRNA-specific ribonuclease
METNTGTMFTFGQHPVQPLEERRVTPAVGTPTKYAVHVKIKDTPGKTNDLILTTTVNPDETFDDLLCRIKSSMLASQRHGNLKQYLDRYTHFKDATCSCEYLGEMTVREVWKKEMIVVMELDPVPESDSEEEKIVWVGANTVTGRTDHLPIKGETSSPREESSNEIWSKTKSHSEQERLRLAIGEPKLALRSGLGEPRPDAVTSLKTKSKIKSEPFLTVTYLDLQQYNSLRVKQQFAEYNHAKNHLLNYYQVLLGKELPVFRVTSQGRDSTLKYYAEVDVTDLVYTDPQLRALAERSENQIKGYGAGKRKTEAENLAAVHALAKLKKLGVATPSKLPGHNINPKIEFNELHQFYYQQPPQYHIEVLHTGDATIVKAMVTIEELVFEGCSFSKSKATRNCAEKALAYLRKRR